METTLQIIRNFWQDDWSDLLLVVQYQLNAHVSSATNQIPYETWMGFVPRVHQPEHDSLILNLKECKLKLQKA